VNAQYPNFLDLEESVARDPSAPAAVLPVPYERTVCFGRGTARGPAAILQASTQVELFDEELLREPAWRIQTLAPVELGRAAGEDAMQRIHAAAAPVFAAGRFLLGLGGEHSITPALVQAAAEGPGTVDVLMLDAHADLRESYQGTPYSHACAGRRLVERGVGTVWVGVRSFSREEYEFARDRRLTLLRARDMHGRTVEQFMPLVLDALGERVYLSIDVDVFDPSLVPGTGTPEPGGLDWYTVVEIIRVVCREKSVVGADIVELAPVAGSHVSEFVAARLAAKLLLEAVFRG